MNKEGKRAANIYCMTKDVVILVGGFSCPSENLIKHPNFQKVNVLSFVVKLF